MRALLAPFAVLVAAACSDNPRAPGPADAGSVPLAPQWRPVIEGLDGALLSVWGTSPTDVWSVGGPLGNSGFEALVVHFDGVTWHRLPAGKAETFWWVHGTSPSDVWMVGEKGRVTHWDGAAFSELPSGTGATLYGVWAASPTEAWAVGGTPDSPSGENDVLLHWDGASWKPELLPQANHVALFKVWGSSPSDLYVVGDAGIVWHRRDSTWTREAEGLATGRLTTVAGCSATEVYAVGGRNLLVSDGTTWKRADVDPLLIVNDLNGVSCGPGGVVVVGGGSLKLRRVDHVWQSDFGSTPFSDLHGAWADASGAFWGAGGQFNASPVAGAKRQGVVARFAADAVSTVLTASLNP